jgi:RNA polymerase sigma factor (sigma-70 family)
MSFTTTQPKLLSRMLKGDDSAWFEFARAYTPPAIAFLCWFGASEQDAQDLWQKILLKLHLGALHAYRADMGRFRSFLMTSLRNQHRDWLRESTAQRRGGGGTVSGDKPLSPDDPEGATRFEQFEDETQQHSAQTRQAVQESLDFLLRDYPEAREKQAYLDWFWNGAPKRKRSLQPKTPRPKLRKPAHDSDKQIAARHGLKTHQLAYIIKKVEAHLQKRWQTEPEL